LPRVKVTVPIYGWYGDKTLDLIFPDSWTVEVRRMAGEQAPPLNQDQIRERLASPIGTKPLHELAQGKKECAILVDDMTRPTKAWQMIHPILEEIHKGGIGDDHIRVVMAPGAHKTMTLEDYVKKLGEDVPERYEVFNHNPYENHVYLGKTSQGTPVSVNREVMDCDLKVCVGGIIPHPGAGYGGGAKLILPGVSSIETIDANHKRKGPWRGSGKIEGNLQRLDMEEAGRMAGVDFIVNALFNINRDVVELVCGDMVAAHRGGVKIARMSYVTDIAPDADIVVANGYPQEDEAYKAFPVATESVRQGGEVVILAFSPEGCRHHFYSGKFGRNYGGRAWESPKLRPKLKRLIMVTPHHQLKDEGYYAPKEQSLWVKSWAEAFEELYTTHGPKARVAVYPCSTIQVSKSVAALP